MSTSKKTVAGVAFDAEGYNYSRETWSQVFHDIATAMEKAGLPSTYGDDWDVCREGYSFQGDPKTVLKIRKVLDRMPVNVVEVDSRAAAGESVAS